MKRLDLFVSFLFSLILSLTLLLNSCDGKVPLLNGNEGTDLLIRVLDKALSKPVANARVSLQKDNSTIAGEQLTNSNGETTFKNVTPGDGYIAFVNNALGYKSGASPLIKVETNSESTVLLDRLGNGQGSGLIAGSVKDKTSKLPISRLSVSYAGPVGNGASRPIFTNENGTFVIDGLVAGKYTLTFQASGYERIQKQVTVQDGQSSNIETVFLARQGGVQSTGNYLVSLSGARKVVEIDKSGSIIWSYSQLKSIESAVRTNTGDTVVTDSNSSKVIQVGKGGNVVSSYGEGTIISTLKYPSWVDTVDGTTMLITDNGGNKVVEYVNGKQSWSYATGLLRPRSAVYLNNGNILITDTGNRRVLEVSKQGNVVWSFNENMDKPVHAIRISNGNTLITDASYSRVLEVNYKGQVVWWFAGDPTAPASPKQNNPSIGLADSGSFDGNAGDGADLPNPSVNSVNSYAQEETPVAPGNNLLFPRSAERLSDGNTLIADTGNNRIVEVSRDKKIVWELGNLPRPVSVERL